MFRDLDLARENLPELDGRRLELYSMSKGCWLCSSVVSSTWLSWCEDALVQGCKAASSVSVLLGSTSR
jgi:hypothetical protein